MDLWLSSAEIYILRGPGANERLIVLSAHPLGTSVEMALGSGLTVSTLLRLDNTLTSILEDQLLATLPSVDGIVRCYPTTNSIKVVGTIGTSWSSTYSEMQASVAGLLDLEPEDVHVRKLGLGD